MGKKGRDGLNWYIYVRNNPLGFVDPTGLEPRVPGIDTYYADVPRQRRDRLISAQYETRNNTKYWANQGGNFNMPAEGRTWCNQSTFDIAFGTGFLREVFGGASDRSNWRDASYNINANSAAQKLAANARVGENYAPDNPHFIKEVEGEQAFNLANEGFTVVAAWENPSGRSGHLATVSPSEGEYDSTLGPIVSNIGGGTPSIQYASEAFGVGIDSSDTANSLQEIKYYFYPNQEFGMDDQQLNNSWGYSNEE